MLHGCGLGFTVVEEGGAGAREKGFSLGVEFVALNTEYHGAVVFDVVGELGGGVTGFVKMVGRGFVVYAGAGILECDGVRRWKTTHHDTCHILSLGF